MMTDREKYLFDLNGYLVVEDVLTPEQVHAMNEAIDHNGEYIRIRNHDSLSGAADRHWWEGLGRPGWRTRSRGYEGLSKLAEAVV